MNDVNEIPEPAQLSSPRAVSMSHRRMLVTWSGGLDSTYGLVRILNETDDEVFVHHIHRFAPQDDSGEPALSARYEAAAVARMLPLIRERCRSFNYSESLVDNTAFPQFAPDATTVLLLAGCMARRLGFSREDRILDVMNSDEDGDWRPGSLSGQLLRMNSLNILKLVSGSEDMPELYTYDGIPTKADEVAYLPRELVELNASCRAPRLVDGTWRGCGVCRKCRSFARMGVSLPGDAEDGDRLREIDDQLRAADPRQEVEIRPYGVRKQLVMWSGGEKSTAALLRLLEESDHPVHVHHVMSTERLDRQPDADSLGGHAFSDVTAMLHDIRCRCRSFKATMSAIDPSRAVGHTTLVRDFAAEARKRFMEPRFEVVHAAFKRLSEIVDGRQGAPAKITDLFADPAAMMPPGRPRRSSTRRPRAERPSRHRDRS